MMLVSALTSGGSQSLIVFGLTVLVEPGRLSDGLHPANSYTHAVCRFIALPYPADLLPASSKRVSLCITGTLSFFPRVPTVTCRLTYMSMQLH